MSLNVLIPMAGAGSRFLAAGYKNPKPFIDILGKPMITHIIDNVAIPGAKYIFLAQKEHMKEFGSQFIEQVRKRTFIKDFEVLTVDRLTEGAACTALIAKEFINNNDELLIANSDQLVGEGDVIRAVLLFEKRNVDGGIMCFYNRNIKWSYVEVSADRRITRVAEKQPISEHANVGIYWWKHGNDFVASAERMIEKNDRVNGEFYIAPSYNYLIMDDKTIEPYWTNEMNGLGTPEDLEKYLTK